MPKIKLTTAAVAKLTPPKVGRVDYFDATLPAFGLRVSSTGARKWFLMTRVAGKQIRITLGVARVDEDSPGMSLAEARRKAGEMMEARTAGHDPRQAEAEAKRANQQKAKDTFGVVAKVFLSEYVQPRLRPPTISDYRMTLGEKSTITADWRDRPIANISKTDVRTLLRDRTANAGPIAANKTLAYLSKFFNWAAEQDHIEVPPTIALKAPNPKRRGERTLSREEIPEVLAAIEKKAGALAPVFKLLLLTGQRRSEVAGMRWDELRDLDGVSPIWELPAVRSKNRLAHLIPLSPAAVDIIKAQPRMIYRDGDQNIQSAFVFTSTGRTAVTGFSNAKERVDAEIAAERRKIEIPPMAEWDLHDLRRTVSTGMNDWLGIRPHVVEAVLNHISGDAKRGVAGTYNKALYLEERRQALTAWANLVVNLATGANRADNVVNLAGAR